MVPDILTMAKGLSGAYVPLGATIVRKHIGDCFKEQFFSHGATYAGHALACAAATAVIPIYQEDNLIENSEKMGNYLLEKSLELKEKHPSVGEVREVICNRAGKPTTVGCYGFDTIGGVFLEYNEDHETASLVLRYRNTSQTVHVAEGTEAQLISLRDRLAQDLMVQPKTTGAYAA